VNYAVRSYFGKSHDAPVYDKKAHAFANPATSHWFSDPGTWPLFGALLFSPIIGVYFAWGALNSPGVHANKYSRKMPLRGYSEKDLKNDPVLRDQIFELNHSFSEDNMPCKVMHHKHNYVPENFHGMDKDYHLAGHQSEAFPTDEVSNTGQQPLVQSSHNIKSTDSSVDNSAVHTGLLKPQAYDETEERRGVRLNAEQAGSPSMSMKVAQEKQKYREEQRQLSERMQMAGSSNSNSGANSAQWQLSEQDRFEKAHEKFEKEHDKNDALGSFFPKA
jgi:hypothetical protein